MENKKIKTGILSFGMSGRVFHAPFINENPGFSFDAVVERSIKRVGNIYPEVMSYDSVDELLDDPVIELVVVNTPNYLHYEHAKAALKKGKHILVEKPFTATIEQAEELFILAKDNNLHVFVYQNRRLDSDFMSVRRIIESGRLGKLCEVHFRFDRYKKQIGQKSFKENKIDASGLIYDLGPHVIDQVVSLFGFPLSYSKLTGYNRPGTQVDDYFFIQMDYPGGLNVTVASSLLVADPQAAFIVHGTDGSFIKMRADVQEKQLEEGLMPGMPAYGIEPEDKKGKLTLMDAEGNSSTEAIESPQGNYMGIFDAVYNTVRNNKPFPVTPEQILCQLEIIGS